MSRESFENVAPDGPTASAADPPQGVPSVVDGSLGIGSLKGDPRHE